MEPYLGQICLFGFNFAPTGWALCNGQLLSIAQNSALFALLGTQYGGDGVNTFALPDLQGRLALGQGNGPGLAPRTIGEKSGTENVTMLSSQMPQHTHALMVSNAPASADTPVNNVLAVVSAADGDGISITAKAYGPTADGAASPSAISLAGGNQPLPVMQPYLALNYCIALTGGFPSRN